MSQVSLQNKDQRVLKAGDYVKFAPNTRTACVFALIGDSNIIGACAEQIYPGKWGLVNLLGAMDGTLYYTKSEIDALISAPVYGSMYADNVSLIIVVVSSETYYEITSSLTGGEENGCIFQNSHEIMVPRDGRYLIVYSISGYTASVANKEMEGAIMVNNAAQSQGTSHAEVSPGGSGRPETVSGNGIFALSAGDLISLAVSNHTDTTDFVIEHVSLSILYVGA